MDDKQGSREKQGLPGTVSDQNNEEAPGGEEPSRRPAGSGDGGDESSGGESGEGSQSTGNPNSAG